VALIWKGVDTITQQASWGYQIMAADGNSTDELVALNDQLGSHTSALSLVALEGGGFAIDGPTRRGSPHPRGAGTMPRVLGRFVRERRALSLADAIHKMTARPADRVHLRDRGRLAVGMAGDVVVFDAATVADRADFANPFQYPVGISAVIVNGAVAVRDGQHLANRGRVVRAG
jgi:N-acyl-D-amino-acid deacylase